MPALSTNFVRVLKEDTGSEPKVHYLRPTDASCTMVTPRNGKSRIDGMSYPRTQIDHNAKPFVVIGDHKDILKCIAEALTLDAKGTHGTIINAVPPELEHLSGEDETNDND